jgi:hypothetical protein
MTQVSEVPARTRAQIAEKTLRKDPWWRQPAIVVTLLSIWVLYATVRVFMGHYYWVPAYHYLTPFYSPCINGECVPGSSSLGHWFPAVPPIIPYAVISLPFVLGFRLTCYYYRRAYYRAFWFPLIMQNLHRYFFYAAILISILNTFDAVDAFHGKDGGAGFGLGSLIIVVNVVLLWGYTLSCHSCRHITGGRLKNFSKHPVRYWAWTQISKLNAKHMQLAWTTLGTLMLTDLYVMLVASGAISDLRFFN